MAMRSPDPARTARVIAATLLVWGTAFVVSDFWLLGTTFENYRATGQFGIAAVALAMNLAIFAWLVLLLAAVTGRYAASVLLVAGSHLLIALVSKLKLANLGEPLFPWDYLSAGQFASMSTGYVALDAQSWLIVALFAAAWLGALYVGLRERPIRRAVPTAAAGVLTLALYAVYFPDTQRKPLGMLNMTWAQAYNLRSHGVFNHLALNVRPALIAVPAGYDPGAIEQACADASVKGVGVQVNAAHPHVILVMNEAFTRIDRTFAADVTFSTELAPFFSSLRPVALSVPTFGGITANVEFEILTGTPVALLPAGSVAYQQYLKRPLHNALPRLFKRAGYLPVALHPYQRTFWARDVAYRHLGFDRFIAIDDLKLPAAAWYVRDAELVSPIVDLVSSSPEPLFLFVTTIENHGPWFKDRYERFDVEVRAMPPSWTPAARTALQNYAQGVRNGDEFLRMLVERFKGRDDVVIAMFGDHHPTIVVPDMGNYNLMAHRFGDPARVVPPEFEQRAILQTEIVFWPKPLPFEPGAQATLIGPALARRAGVPLDGFWSAVERIGARYPIVQKRFVTTAAGEAVPPSKARELRALHLLQYDALFGERHAERYCGSTASESR